MESRAGKDVPGQGGDEVKSVFDVYFEVHRVSNAILRPALGVEISGMLWCNIASDAPLVQSKGAPACFDEWHLV